jgi:hypothetical protein
MTSPGQFSFLRPDYFPAKAEAGEPATFEQVLNATSSTANGFINPFNVFNLTNNNMGTGFRDYLEGSTNQYPMSALPERFNFSGVQGFRPQHITTQKLINMNWLPDGIYFT